MFTCTVRTYLPRYMNVQLSKMIQDASLYNCNDANMNGCHLANPLTLTVDMVPLTSEFIFQPQMR